MSERTQVQGLVGQVGVRDPGNIHDLAASRQGALISQDQVFEWALAGRLFHAQQGDAGTQLDFAETAYDEDQPQFALRVPTGRAVVPLSLVVTFQDQAGTDTHVIWSRTTNDIGNGTSTAATISALRSDAPYESGCTARSLYTGNATAATGLIEVARFVDPFAAEADRLPRYEWSYKTAGFVPVLVGPATLQLHVFATTTQPQGFGEYVWAEFETPYLVKT